jgi:hypothetical protein
MANLTDKQTFNEMFGNKSAGLRDWLIDEEEGKFSQDAFNAFILSRFLPIKGLGKSTPTASLSPYTGLMTGSVKDGTAARLVKSAVERGLGVTPQSRLLREIQKTINKTYAGPKLKKVLNDKGLQAVLGMTGALENEEAQLDTTNKATDIGKQTLNEIFGNKSAEADSLQQDAIRRLQEGGLIGKQGRALVDRLTFDPSDTGPIFGENPTTELDSLQRDAVDRLRSGGMFGKQGRRLRDWLEAQDWLWND